MSIVKFQNAAFFVFAILIVVSGTFINVVCQTREKVNIVQSTDADVFVVGKDVTVSGTTRGVLVLGGDLEVAGHVNEDVGVIGGDIVQTKAGYIGGDVIVFGGTYRSELEKPLRVEGKQTVMFAGYRDELRGYIDNPFSAFSPEFSKYFVLQRILSIIFWFIISMFSITLAPGAISRAATRFKLHHAKVSGIGLGILFLTTLLVIVSFSALPEFASGIFAVMVFVLLVFAYVFGRITVHNETGKFVIGMISADAARSDSLNAFAGAVVWTLLLSLPYLWIFAVLLLFAVGVGLIATAKSVNSWAQPVE